MQTLTPIERNYVWLLVKRNSKSQFKDKTKPLKKPMGIEERKLRSNIRKKCRIYMEELVLAEMSGAIPDRKMVEEEGFNSVSEAIEKKSLGLIMYLLELEKEETA
jgi:hypothetical protein